MKFIVERQLDYFDECASLIAQMVNCNEEGKTGFDLCIESINGVSNEEINMKNDLNLIKKVAEDIFPKINIPFEKLKFYFLDEIGVSYSIANMILRIRRNGIEPATLLGQKKHEVLSKIITIAVTNDEEVNEIIEDEADLINFIESCDCSTIDKWKYILFYHNFHEYDVEVMNILSMASDLLKVKEDILMPLYNREMDYVENIVNKGQGEELLKRYTIIPDNNQIVFIISLFNFKTIRFDVQSVCTQEGKKVNQNLYIGVLVNPKINFIEKKADSIEQLLSMLKVLTDKSRLEILKSLKDENLCGQDITARLNISPATVSHHMNMLATQRFIVYKKRGTKINYNINYDGIKRCLSHLEAMLLP